MESKKIQEFSQLLSCAMWAQQTDLTQEELLQIAQSDSLDFSDEQEKIIYEGILSFSNKTGISFCLCCSHVLELYLTQKITTESVERHLSNEFDKIVKNSSEKKLPQDGKTILLLGRSGEGKSRLTNHLVGREVAKVGNSAESQTLEAELYYSEKYQLNIIDTEGLDGTSETISNEELLEKLLMKTVYYLDLRASIDAIIIMWCPIRNARSGLKKTINLVKKIFGEEALKSCIFMIQGNWRPLAELLDLGVAVPKEKEALKTKFPDIPVIEYDVKGSVEEQFPDLEDAIHKVQPYKKDYFERKRKQEFINMSKAIKIRIQRASQQNLPQDQQNLPQDQQNLPQDQQNILHRLFLNIKSEIFELMNHPETALNNKRSIWREAAVMAGKHLFIFICNALWRRFRS